MTTEELFREMEIDRELRRKLALRIDTLTVRDVQGMDTIVSLAKDRNAPSSNASIAAAHEVIIRFLAVDR